MNFVKIPNLPDDSLRLAVVDGRLSAEACSTFADMDVELVMTDKMPGLYEAISCHPDLVLHHVGGNRIVYAPGISQELLQKLENRGFELIKGKSVLQGCYPLDIPYNVARVGRWAFHNLKYTDPVLLEELKRQGVEMVHVNQGYAKCSVSVVDAESIITADRAIAAKAGLLGLDVLLIEECQNIMLPGIDRGFIGGSTGLIDKDLWAINGNVHMLKSFDSIRQFLKKRNIGVVSLTSGQPVDIGTILPLLQK